MKRIILCADDYGQNKPISQAIITLIEKKRLSATSCLVTAPDWPEYAKWLRSLRDHVQVGLHFNLTEKQTGLQYPLSQLLIRAYLHRLDKAAIQAEFSAQLEKFVIAMGGLPDFIDGHQHIHQFPIIREAILESYEQNLRHQPCYVRCVFDKKAFFRGTLKHIIIQLSGAATFKKQLEQREIAHNSSFAGIYNFADSQQYAQFFPQFLQQIQEGGIIMCHPGLTSSREHEYRYFLSDEFLQACEAAQVVIN